MKKLAIVGSHPGTRDLVPWDDETFDIWTINESATQQKTENWVKRTTGIFQLHPRHVWDSPLNKNDPHHGEWLKANKMVRVFMLEKYPDVPMAEKYPLDEIAARYLSNFNVHSHRSRREFFTNTVAYMAALAIYEGYDLVHIYGVELSVESEYRYQRPGATFWIGILAQHAEVHFFGQMFDAPIYGIEKDGDIDRGIIEQRIEVLRPQVAEEQKKMEAANVAFITALRRFRDTGVEYEAATATMKHLAQTINTFGMVSGALQELEKRLNEIKVQTGIDGEFRFSHHEFERAATAIQNEREKAALEHSHMAGQIDALFAMAVEDRLKDSHRKKLVDTIHRMMPTYGPMMERLSVYSGAIAENKLLQSIIREQMIDDNT